MQRPAARLAPFSEATVFSIFGKTRGGHYYIFDAFSTKQVGVNENLEDGEAPETRGVKFNPHPRQIEH